MAGKEAARGSGNFARAKHVHSDRDMRIVPRDEWDWAMKRLGWVLGICFGVMFAIALIAG